MDVSNGMTKKGFNFTYFMDKKWKKESRKKESRRSKDRTHNKEWNKRWVDKGR
jgi:hypothetical protein